MPQVVLERHSAPKWLRYSVPAMAVLLIIAAIGGYFAWRLFPSSATTVKKAEALDSSGNYTEAEALLQSGYGRAFTKDDKAMLLSWLAATKSDMGDNNAALNDYEQLNSLQPHNEANLEMLGALAYQMGNKTVALSADQQELPLMKAQTPGPTTLAEITALEQQIGELKK